MSEIDLEKIQNSPNLLDVLLQIEDILDSLDIYVFKNWYKGVVVEGPTIKRYWLDIVLRYNHDQMPDPRAALRLLKHGIRVDFKKARLQNGEYDNSKPMENGNNVAEEDEEETDDKNMIWLVNISVPRRLADQMAPEEEEEDYYEDEVDTEDVQDAEDADIDSESAYMKDEQNQEQNNPQDFQ